jgi:hypothetical protein
MHLDNGAAPPDISLPADRPGLLDGGPSRDRIRQHVLSIGVVLTLEEFPGRHADEPSPASASAMTKANSGLELGKSAHQVRNKQRNAGRAEARGLRLKDRNRRHLPGWLWSVGRRPITDQTNPAANSISQHSFAGR